MTLSYFKNNNYFLGNQKDYRAHPVQNHQRQVKENNIKKLMNRLKPKPRSSHLSLAALSILIY